MSFLPGNFFFTNMHLQNRTKTFLRENVHFYSMIFNYTHVYTNVIYLLDLPVKATLHSDVSWRGVNGKLVRARWAVRVRQEAVDCGGSTCTWVCSGSEHKWSYWVILKIIQTRYTANQAHHTLYTIQMQINRVF